MRDLLSRHLGKARRA